MVASGFDLAYDRPGQPLRGERVLGDVQHEAAAFGDAWTLRALADEGFGPAANAAVNEALVAALGTGPRREAVLHTRKDGTPTLGNGSDLVVLLDKEGAFGAGHTAVMIGNDQTGWRLYSKDGARGANQAIGQTEWTNNRGPNQVTGDRFAFYPTLDHFFEDTAISDKYEAAVRFELGNAVDRGPAAQVAAEAVLSEDYNVSRSSCAHVVEAALEAAGVEGFSVTETRTTYSLGYSTLARAEEADRADIVPRIQFRQAQRLDGDDDVKSHKQIGWELRSRTHEPE